MSTDNSSAVVSLYVVKNGNGHFFAGYDSTNKKANLVEHAIFAKKFSNKYDIKLRPDETIVELSIDLAQSPVSISEPFRPHRRKLQSAE